MMYYELYHHGVPGMKWGVRRDTRIIANHRRNVEIKQLKEQYRSGGITKKQYSSAVRGANLRKKQYISDIKDKFQNTKSDSKREKLSRDISNTAVKEVPDIQIKRGLAVTNQIFGAVGIGNVALTSAAAAAINPAFAVAYIGAGVVSAAAETGFRYVTRTVLDKTS